MMYAKSPWEKILSAPSTSQAIQRAAVFPAAVLSGAPLPVNYETLSAHAQKNARAVRRALSVKIAGLPDTGWEVWQETEEERTDFARTFLSQDGNEKGIVPADVTMDEGLSDEEIAKVRKTSPVVEIAEKLATTPAEGKQLLARTTAYGSLQSSRAQSTGKTSEERNQVQDKAAGLHAAEEVRCAEQLKNWATSCPHTTPPVEAVQCIIRSACIPDLLRIIVPHALLSKLLAAVVGAFTENIGSGFANHLVRTLVLPYAKDLNAPVPRDIMQAIVGFSEQHWRSVVTLFEHFSAQDTPVNGPVAELLVRVSVAISVPGAMESLRAFFRASWGEDGIRVVEALLVRCRNEKGLASVLIPALERNVLGSEKSVRFGKLLFSTVKDVPDIASDHLEAMESICSRSKVFLAKRALAMLQRKGSKI